MNRERIQELRDVIAGIPAKQVNLSWPFVGKGTQHKPPEPCGAVACLAGWAWIYPPFVEAGIRNAPEDGVRASAYQFFDLPQRTQLFAANHERFDGGSRLSDKAIALNRLDRLLDENLNGVKIDSAVE